MPVSQDLEQVIDELVNPSSSQESVHIILHEPQIADTDAQKLEDAISSSMRIKRLKFERISIPPYLALHLARAAILNPHINDVSFPVWGTTNSPGQGPVMELEEELQSIVKNMNRENRTNLVAFSYFKKLNDKIFKVDANQYAISNDVLDDHLKPFLVTTKKVTL